MDKSVQPEIERSLTPIRRHQSSALRWCNDPFQFAGGAGLREEDPTFFLLAYWMARYHGLADG